jgi:hypothetical protein
MAVVHAPIMPYVAHAVPSSGDSGNTPNPVEYWDGTSLRLHIRHLGEGFHEPPHCTKLVRGLILPVFAGRVMF